MCAPEFATVIACLCDFVNKNKLRNIPALGSRQTALRAEGLDEGG